MSAGLVLLLCALLDVGTALSPLGQGAAAACAALLVLLAARLPALAARAASDGASSATGPSGGADPASARSLPCGAPDLTPLLRAAVAAAALSAALTLLLAYPGRGALDGLLCAWGAALGLAALLRAPARAALAGAVLLGAALLLRGMARLPIDPAVADMLPLVERALSRLRAGQSPYAVYRLPWELPLTYLPLTWLSYLPPYLLGLDLRWSNLLCGLALAAAAARPLWRLPPPRAEAPLLLLAAFCLRPTLLDWSLRTAAPPFWLLLFLLLRALSARAAAPAALALGAALAASPLGAVALPFAALHLVLRRRRQAASILGGAALLCAALVAPFCLWAPGDFRYGVLRWFNDNDLFPRLAWRLSREWAHNLGLSGLLWQAGAEALLKPAQALLLVALAVCYGRRGASLAQLPWFLAAAYLLFAALNPVLWPYLYNPAAVAALWSALSCALAPQTGPSSPSA